MPPVHRDRFRNRHDFSDQAGPWRSGRLGPEPMKRRRVNDRTAVPLSLVAGIVAAASGASPTGATWSDWIVIVASVALVTWAGASAPWWAAAAVAGLAAGVAVDVTLTVIGLVAFAVGLWIGLQGRDVALARAAVVGVAMNVLIRSELDGFLGLSTIIGVAAGVAVLTIGLARRRSRIRRRVWWGLALTAVLGVLAVAGSAVAALSSRDDLTSGNRQARAALELVNGGDYAAAAASFDQAAASFAGADDALTAPWALPARLVPGVAQNLTAAQGLASAAAEASIDLSAALSVVDPEQLRVVDGRFDIDAVRLIQEPFHEVQDSIGALESAIDDAESPWLISPLATRLADLDEELTDNGARLDNAVLAVDLAPQLLGADEPRRYFVAFTTPAEVRGHGGFMGNWVELTADEGRLTVSDSGRTGDLNRATTDARSITGPQDWVDQWGRYGFTNGPDGSTGDVPWSNVTISPQFPSTAQVIAELYPQSGGAELDGVFAMDPYVLEALLGMTGPVSVDSTDAQLDRRNVLQFLLVDQYEIDDSPTRIDLLDEVSRATIDRVLGGALPNPTVVARELGPVAAEGRLTGWARDPAEQELFDRVKLSAALPRLDDGDDGYAVVLNNAGANKLDVYLGRDIAYDAVVDPATGAVEATLTVELTNEVTVDGLPDSVTGNYTGDEIGTNRTLLTLYSPLTLVDATVAAGGGPEQSVTFDARTEAGWNTNSMFLAVAPGETVTVTVDLAGTIDASVDGELAVRPMPMVLPEHHRIDVRTTDGRQLVAFDGVIDRPQRLPLPLRSTR